MFLNIVIVIINIFLGWFGIRKDFCQFLLSVFPLLQEYANIAYNNNVNRGSNIVPSESPGAQEPYRDEATHKKDKDKNSHKNQKKNEAMKPVVPVTSIDMPD